MRAVGKGHDKTHLFQRQGINHLDSSWQCQIHAIEKYLRMFVRAVSDTQKLIPAIIPDLNHAVFDPDRKCRSRLVGRRRQGFTGSNGKTGTVARADDHVIFDATAGQLAAVMGADILDRVERLIQLEHRDAGAVYFNMHRLADGNFFRSTNVHPLAQSATTSMSGSMVRARLPIAESVPARELGQLPHAPK